MAAIFYKLRMHIPLPFLMDHSCFKTSSHSNAILVLQATDASEARKAQRHQKENVLKIER
jgi:hypothetical protein